MGVQDAEVHSHATMLGYSSGLDYICQHCDCRLQDSEAYNQRNIAQEGGGGYIAFVWDCAYWGTQVKLAQFTGDTKYSSEVCGQCLHEA